jgi:hypothetical protein
MTNVSCVAVLGAACCHLLRYRLLPASHGCMKVLACQLCLRMFLKSVLHHGITCGTAAPAADC